MTRRDLFASLVGIPLVGAAGFLPPPPSNTAVTVFINGVITQDVIDQFLIALEDQFNRGVVLRQ